LLAIAYSEYIESTHLLLERGELSFSGHGQYSVVEGFASDATMEEREGLGVSLIAGVGQTARSRE
jgi:hypothetical protein